MSCVFPPAAQAYELSLTRLIDAPRDKLFRCWTEPALIVQWFTPPPWKTIHAETDVRAGGASYIVMQGPPSSTSSSSADRVSNSCITCAAVVGLTRRLP